MLGTRCAYRSRFSPDAVEATCDCLVVVVSFHGYNIHAETQHVVIAQNSGW